MSLRITQGMLYARALQDIRNSTLDRVRLQQQAATGRRVNRPSDDPAATLRIMPMRAEVRNLGQLIDNVALARETLNLGAASLQDASELMQRVRELTVQGANGTNQQSDRDSIADEIDQILQSMVGLGNSDRTGRFLFGGTDSDSAPFRIVNDSAGTRVEYSGNQNIARIEVAPGVYTDLNVPGDSIFQSHDRGATTIDGDTGAAPGSGSDSGVGLGKLQVTFANLDVPTGTTGLAAGSGTTTALGELNYTYGAGPPATLSINGGPAVDVSAGGDFDIPVGTGSGAPTVSLDISGAVSPATGTLTAEAYLSIDGGQTTTLVDDYSSSTSYQVRSGVDDSVLNVGVAALTRTGTDMVTYGGTFDVFSTLVGVRDLLRNDYSLTSNEISQKLSGMLGEIDTAHDNLLDGLRGYGNRSDQMNLLAGRVEEMQTSIRESLSRDEDADIAETVLAMTQQDFAFQAALQVSARIVQTSLLNFLR